MLLTDLSIMRPFMAVLHKMGYAAPKLTQQKKSINNNPVVNRTKTKKMKKGTVKFFNEAKGFGFIKSEDGQELFVHVTGLKEEIRENDNVTFEVEQGKKGLNAVNVSLA